jgi:protein-L-isoaspartate(D-aspartate) O-methyltransferase
VEDAFVRQRARLVAHLEREFERGDGGRIGGGLDPRVRDALLRVPREAFVPPAFAESAYEDRALPIGSGQTISQPFVVALMTQLLAPLATDRVLEIGTGSGYQAAVLSLLVAEVYGVECVASLAREAAERLRRLGYANVLVRHGDGREGWLEHAPFDAILVTAAAPELPVALLEQLRPGGRVVAPLGEPGAGQDLCLGTLDEDGALAWRRVIPVAFVPLV